jgi:hypothetical protein
MKIFQLAIQCVINIGFVPAIENMKFFKIGEYCYRSTGVPSIANCLMIKCGVFQILGRLLCFSIKLYITEIRSYEERIIGATLRSLRRYFIFYLNFLLIRILLPLVRNVPAKRRKELIDKVFTNMLFLIR